jgi:hypothetical protein
MVLGNDIIVLETALESLPLPLIITYYMIILLIITIKIQYALILVSKLL